MELRDLLRLPPVLTADDCCDPLLLVSQLLLHLVNRWILEKFVNVDELLKNGNAALGVFEFLNVKPYKRFKNDKNANVNFLCFKGKILGTFTAPCKFKTKSKMQSKF